ncbi:hypothetical protein B0H14DRAFT_3042643 [Mycena olivaceomarginata]|nr:hypothetical protein B0H14DRAFT_3042643 [Mycena olivaceomarginata]
MSRRERPTDAQRTPPQPVEKPKDKTTPGARQRRIEQRAPYTRIGPVSPPAGYCACAAQRTWELGRRPAPFLGVGAPEPQSGVRARSLLPPTLLLHAAIAGGASRSWVQEARYPSLEFAGAKQAADGEDALVSADGVLSGGGVGLDADAKEVLEANSDAEVGRSTTTNGDRAGGVI